MTRPFVRWLRRQYPFPVRVPVYLSPAPQVVTVHGDRCSASFFAPSDRNVEPHIRVATGEFPSLRRRWGRNRAAVSHLISLAHEVLHYEQWVRGEHLSERGIAQKASAVVGRYLCGPQPNPRLERTGAEPAQHGRSARAAGRSTAGRLANQR